ncbi:unnamed protein product [Sphacelaria rigidula]
MVDVVSKRCGQEGFSKVPSNGTVGSRRGAFGAQHAGTAMVDVVSKRCGHEGFSKVPSNGTTGSRRGGFGAQFAGTAMVDVVKKKCGQEGCSKYIMRDLQGKSKPTFRRKHAVEMADMPTMSTFGHQPLPSTHDPGKSGGRDAIYGRELTLKECTGVGIDATSAVDTRRAVHEGCNAAAPVLPKAPGEPSAGNDDISKEANMKLELVVSRHTPVRSGKRKTSGWSVRSLSDCRSADGCFTSQRSPKRHRILSPTVSRHSGVETETVVGEGVENVKLELALSYSSPSLI